MMRLIDVEFLDTPFFGVRQMTWNLRSSRDRGPSGAA
jgi:putative transposase